MDGGYFLCIFFSFALIQSAAASGDLRKNAGVAHHTSTSDSAGTVNMDKPIGLFSRRRPLPQVRQNVPRQRTETGSVAPASGRLQGLMEPCSATSPCTGPCDFCHCRLFNTICQCWRISACHRKN